MNLPFISVMNSVLRGLIPYEGGGKVEKFPFASCLRNQKPRQFEKIGPYVDCNFPLRCFLWYVFVVSWLRITLVQFTLKLVSRGYRWDRVVAHTCFCLTETWPALVCRPPVFITSFQGRTSSSTLWWACAGGEFRKSRTGGWFII